MFVLKKFQYHMNKILLLLLTAFLFTSCHNSKKKAVILPSKIENQGSKIKTTQYKTQSGKQFIIHADYSKGASICNLKIETKDFTERNTIHNFGLTDPLTNVFIIDLDKNGFEEIYVITTSAGSGSYSTIFGLASNKDKSTTPIYVPKPSQDQLEQGGIFEGFRGHNKFSLQNGVITNTFPIYRDSDSNSSPTGKDKKLSYSLVAGEAGWILRTN